MSGAIHPAGQRQPALADPALALCQPAGQGVQVAMEAAPVADDQVPAGQGVGSMEDSGQYEPAGQGTGTPEAQK